MLLLPTNSYTRKCEMTFFIIDQYSKDTMKQLVFITVRIENIIYPTYRKIFHQIRTRLKELSIQNGAQVVLV